jgi:hypothetical protein
MVNDVKAFEVQPHGMRGISQAPVCESIASQQIAELIMDRWFGNAQGRNQSCPQTKHQEPHSRDGEHFSSGQLGEPSFDGKESRKCGTGLASQQGHRNHNRDGD